MVIICPVVFNLFRVETFSMALGLLRLLFLIHDYNFLFCLQCVNLWLTGLKTSANEQVSKGFGTSEMH